MKFVVIEDTDRGPAVITQSRTDVIAYFEAAGLKVAAQHVKAHDWAPGHAMSFHGGWLFSVHDHVEL